VLRRHSGALAQPVVPRPRKGGSMRIVDEDGRELDRIYLALTASEAKELHDWLEQLIVDPSIHAHVMDERFWART